MIVAETEGKFPGGQVLNFDAKNNGVGIPEENPNLSADVQKATSDVFDKIVSGAIIVSAEQGNLIK